jgi:lipopolysaccharide transport system ATP-binding protein
MSSNCVININNLSKEYLLGSLNFKSFILRNSNLKKKIALQNINCKIFTNERVAIIGKNGSGKSTLLKILSRVTTPTSGQAIVNGRMLSMLETGAGFDREFTLLENIYLNASLLGASEKEIKIAINQIIDFAELREFVNVPLKRFSSGMIARLGFSIGLFIPSEILIIDEILSVVDGKFRKKCILSLSNPKKKFKKTILFVSHNMYLVKNICERGIVLDNGKIIYDDKIEKVINFYKKNLLK